MSKATFFIQAFNGLDVGSHIPDSYQGNALYEGIKLWSDMGYKARSVYLASYIEKFGAVDFLKANVFPAPCHSDIAVFFHSAQTTGETQ
jgi:hypothetical protein